MSHADSSCDGLYTLDHATLLRFDDTMRFWLEWSIKAVHYNVIGLLNIRKRVIGE